MPSLTYGGTQTTDQNIVDTGSRRVGTLSSPQTCARGIAEHLVGFYLYRAVGHSRGNTAPDHHWNPHTWLYFDPVAAKIFRVSLTSFTLHRCGQHP